MKEKIKIDDNKRENLSLNLLEVRIIGHLLTRYWKKIMDNPGEEFKDVVEENSDRITKAIIRLVGDLEELEGKLEK